MPLRKLVEPYILRRLKTEVATHCLFSKEQAALHRKPVTELEVAFRQAEDEGAIRRRAIAKTFWGKASCQNLKAYSDYQNRLPRGRSYVRHGTVLHLAVHAGRIQALVYGSSTYGIDLEIKPLPKKRWHSARIRRWRGTSALAPHRRNW